MNKNKPYKTVESLIRDKLAGKPVESKYSFNDAVNQTLYGSNEQVQVDEAVDYLVKYIDPNNILNEQVDWHELLIEQAKKQIETSVNQKNGLAVMIANTMGRINASKKDNSKQLLLLLAALTLLNSSNGQDLLIQAARRLMVLGNKL